MGKITDSKILTEKSSESSVSQCTDTKVAEMGKWELENGEKTGSTVTGRLVTHLF